MTGMKVERPMDRFDSLRRKHQQTDSTRQGSSPATAPAVTRKVSPVVTSKSNQDTRTRVGVTPQSKRKVVYKVGANGVETRLPALPYLRFSWQWISGLMTILLFLLVIIMINSPMFRVNTLSINGLSRYTPEEFQPLIENRKTSIFLFNTNPVMNSLRIVFPELVDPQINISMPNEVLVSASERQPIILWQAGSTPYWIDEKGVVMVQRGEVPGLLTVQSSVTPPLTKMNADPVSIVDYARMIIERQSGGLTNDELVNHINPETLNAIIEMNKIIPAGGSLVYDPISGMGWRDPGGWEVYFGTDLTNIDFKQVEYQTILAKLVEMGVTPAMISVEHIDAPYFRME